MEDRTKQLMISIPLFVVGVCAICFVLWHVAKEHKRTEKIDKEIARQQEIADEITRGNAMLEKTISYLESDEAQKFNAQKLGYQEEDQNVARVKDITKAQNIIEERLQQQRERESVTGTPDQKAHWQVWWEVFFGVK